MKIKSLALEAGIIRFEEKRQRSTLRESLYRHRVEDVRAEQRASLLAYAYIRGKSYSAAEPKPKTVPPQKRVAQLVATFGARSSDRQQISNDVQSWMRGDLCGQGQGVMTPGQTGSTPVPRPMLE